LIDQLNFKNSDKLRMEDTILQTKASRRQKFAIFDFDWTIVKPKEGRKFPTNADDWQYIRKSVPEIIQKYHKTHQIVIVTDQSKPWKVEQIQQVVKDLKLEDHTTVIIGVKTQKPDTSLFLKIFPKFKPENSFYVGDAAGRKDDWSDKDKEFAHNLGVKFWVPEEQFPLDEIQNAIITKSKTQEVVIMIGYPASGKSTIAATLEGYHIVSGDVHKTVPAMLKDASRALDKSIVFDSTAGTKAKRAEFVKFAQKHKLPVRAIWVKTPIDVAMERNKTRALSGHVKIPDIAFYVYRKNFEEPTEDEGFTLVSI